MRVIGLQIRRAVQGSAQGLCVGFEFAEESPFSDKENWFENHSTKLCDSSRPQLEHWSDAHHDYRAR
jgi:hypothetical protein